LSIAKWANCCYWVMHFDFLLNKGVFMDIEKDEKLEVDSKAISGMIIVSLSWSRFIGRGICRGFNFITFLFFVQWWRGLICTTGSAWDTWDPSLRATKSFKFSLEFVLEKNRSDAEESKDHQEEDSLHCDGVHGGGQLLECRPRLDEDEGGGSDTKEGSSPERKQWNTNDRRHDVDKPVGKEGGDSEKQNVGEKIGSVAINFSRPLSSSLR